METNSPTYLMALMVQAEERAEQASRAAAATRAIANLRANARAALKQRGLLAKDRAFLKRLAR